MNNESCSWEWKVFQRDFIYFDTSSINKEEYSQFLQSYGYENLSIPESFWFFNRWRDFWGWDNISSVVEQTRTFDLENKTTLITKAEALCIMYEHLYLRKKMIDCMPIDKYPYTNPVRIDAHSIYLENWYIPVVDENDKYYKMFWVDSIFYDELLDFDDKKKEPLFAIPVIHEPKCQVKHK